MPNFDTIKSHARCWSESRLLERAKLWPTPLTWTWFLGERCAAYSRADCVEILSVAVGFIQKERVQLPIALRDLWVARTLGEKTALLDAMLALGEWLDAWEAGDRATDSELYEQLADALNAFTGR